MSHPSIRPWAGGLTALAFLLVSQYALPFGGAAQQPLPGAQTEAPLQGIVVSESTGQAVESATVSVVGTDIEMQTGRYGGFAFPDVQPGLISVRVTAPGHPSVTQEVDLKGEGIVFLQFRLPSIAAVLDGLLVGVPPGSSQPTDSRTAADLLAHKIPSLGRPTSGNIGRVADGVVLQLRSAPNSLSQSLEPLVYIDGVRISGSETALEALGKIPASTVLEIEILRGPVAAFLYPFAASGVVLVTTRSGGRGR